MRERFSPSFSARPFSSVPFSSFLPSPFSVEYRQSLVRRSVPPCSFLPVSRQNPLVGVSDRPADPYDVVAVVFGPVAATLVVGPVPVRDVENGIKKPVVGRVRVFSNFTLLRRRPFSYRISDVTRFTPPHLYDGRTTVRLFDDGRQVQRLRVPSDQEVHEHVLRRRVQEENE